jgi:ADP-ribose pyrophosphatase YjhB (NUDIX family)
MSSTSRETDFFQAIASRQLPRIRVAAIVIRKGYLLVQRPTDDPRACYALIGGEYEIGDTFESRIKLEFEEETTAKVVFSKYLFVVENRFMHSGQLIQAVEHYLEVDIDTAEVTSKEPHLSQHWLPIAKLLDYDLKPAIVRDLIYSGSYLKAKHLVVELE